MPIYTYQCTDCNRLSESLEALDTMTIKNVCKCKDIETEHSRVDYHISNVGIHNGGTPRFHPKT